jgi:hypothetical protein
MATLDHGRGKIKASLQPKGDACDLGVLLSIGPVDVRILAFSRA